MFLLLSIDCLLPGMCARYRQLLIIARKTGTWLRVCLFFAVSVLSLIVHLLQ